VWFVFYSSEFALCRLSCVLFIPDALSSDTVSKELDLSSIKDRDWSIYAVSSTTGSGIKPVFTDVVDKIKAFRHFKSGLGSPLKQTASTKKKPSSIEDTDEPKFTCIEDTDSNDNEKVPSLFDSIDKSHKVTDLDADSDVVPSTSTSSNDQPMYARATEENDSIGTSNNSEERRSVSDKSNPTPDTDSEHAKIVEQAQINPYTHRSEYENVNMTSENSKDAVISFDDEDDHSIESERETHENDETACVQKLDDIVRDEEINYATGASV